MRDVLATLDAWRASGLDAGRAVVIRTYGSAPRPEGSVLLRSSDGRIAGSVSGGCVEGAAAEAVDRARESGLTRVVRFGVTDEQAWAVGLACGGTIDVLVEPAVPEAVIGIARGSLAGAGAAAITVLPAGDATVAPAKPMVVGEDGAFEGSLGTPELDAALASAARDALQRGASGIVVVAERSYFIEAFPPRPRLVIVGAVEIARSLIGFARPLGYETIVIDGRPAFATPERFPDVDRLVLGWPDEVADEIGLGPGDAVAVLSHDPKFDEPAIVTATRRGCRYVGAVGSRRTQAGRRARLRAAGLTDAELSRIRGPIGLDLGGRAVAEIALAVIAEIVAERYGGSARPMAAAAAEGTAHSPAADLVAIDAVVAAR